MQCMGVDSVCLQHKILKCDENFAHNRQPGCVAYITRSRPSRNKHSMNSIVSMQCMGVDSVHLKHKICVLHCPFSFSDMKLIRLYQS